MPVDKRKRLLDNRVMAGYVELGKLVRQGRERRGMSLTVFADLVSGQHGVDLKSPTLHVMEKGEKPGDPANWGAIWKELGLPLSKLYAGLGLPQPADMPRGLPAEVLDLLSGMTEDAQRLVLNFSRQAPGMLAEIRPMWYDRPAAILTDSSHDEPAEIGQEPVDAVPASARQQAHPDSEAHDDPARRRKAAHRGRQPLSGGDGDPFQSSREAERTT